MKMSLIPVLGKEKGGVAVNVARKRVIRPPLTTAKRAKSLPPSNTNLAKISEIFKKSNQRRSASVSADMFGNKSVDNETIPALPPSAQSCNNGTSNQEIAQEKPTALVAHSTLVKLQRVLATKKREFLRMQKSVQSVQKTFMEAYAAVRDLETRIGVADSESVGEARVVSLNSWPAHDLLLVRDYSDMPKSADAVSGLLAPQLLQQLYSQLKPIPDEVMTMGAELMARRIDLLHLVQSKQRAERAANVPIMNNADWKVKLGELDQETDRLQRLVATTAQNLQSKIQYACQLAKIPWLDRETILKKLERLQKDNVALTCKLETAAAAEKISADAPKAAVNKASTPQGDATNLPSDVKTLQEKLVNERIAGGSLKGVVATAEGMLRVARARITLLERQLRDTKTTLEAIQKQHKELEQQYRNQETYADARSKKLLDMPKSGEIAALTKKRDALEQWVKELQEQAEQAERLVEEREAQHKMRETELHAQATFFEKLAAEQENARSAAEIQVLQLETKVKDLEEQILTLRERSGRLVDAARKRCLDYLPTKESVPSERETKLWSEVQSTRSALFRAEDQLRQNHADKQQFLDSLSTVTKETDKTAQDKITKELLDKERRIMKLQQIIDEQRENEKLMEQSMTQYENQMADLRFEVRRLRIYDCYSKEEPFTDLQTELLDLHLQIETMQNERGSLVSTVAARALMLERHERAADLFARVTRARRELAALLDGSTDTQAGKSFSEVSRSLSSVCMASQEAWSALRTERAKVMQLEQTVEAQSSQLERECHLRTQLERHRAMLEREILGHPCAISNSAVRGLFPFKQTTP